MPQCTTPQKWSTKSKGVENRMCLHRGRPDCQAKRTVAAAVGAGIAESLPRGGSQSDLPPGHQCAHHGDVESGGEAQPMMLWVAEVAAADCRPSDCHESHCLKRLTH